MAKTVRRTVRKTSVRDAAVKDTLQNLVSGMGTAKDKITATTFALSFMTIAELEAAYRQDWISRKIIDIPPFDATREWRSWQAPADDITAIERLETKLNVAQKFCLGLQKARLYGGAALIMGINQGQPEDPVNLDQIKEGDLQFLHVVSRYELAVGPVDYNVTSEYYGEPTWYSEPEYLAQITTKGQKQSYKPLVKIHPSRVVRLLGAHIPNIRETQGWADPVLQVIRDAIMAAGIVTNSGAQLVQDAKVDVIQIPRLSKLLANKVYANNLASRLGLANTMKSLYSTLALDTNEKWQRITTELRSLPDVVKTFIAICAGAGDIPVTRMLGDPPKGMNATGDSDIRNYYDRISTEQKTNYTPALARLDEVLVRSALGQYDPTIYYNWNPLWQMDQSQKAEIASKKANVFKIDSDSGLIPSAVLQKARINQLIEDGVYPGLEQDMEEYEAAQEAIPSEGPSNAVDSMIKRIKRKDRQYKHDLRNTRRGTKGALKKTQMSHIPGLDSYLADMKPRSLQITRPVLNAKDILSWARKQGIKGLVPAANLAVLVYQTDQEVDWLRAGEPTNYWSNSNDKSGKLDIPAGGPRAVDQDEDGCIELEFASSALSSRHWDMIYRFEGDNEDAMRSAECWHPEIVIVENATSRIVLDEIKAYQGPILLGPEEFSETLDQAELLSAAGG